MTKKLFTLLLAVAASVGTMFARKVQIGDLYYDLDDPNRTAKVTYKSYTNRKYNEGWGITTANIPASVTNYLVTYSVTSIGDGAFYDCSGLTSVTIPNSVTSIGVCAFNNCSGLTSVTIPNSVTSIGQRAFDGCTGLTSVNITDIAAWCNIAFFSYDSNPLYYAKHLYVNNVEVTNLVIPEGVTSIGSCAFSGCSGLTSITIPNSVISIGGAAFEGCTGLTSVTIPNSVTSIGNNAFHGCSGLTSVTIGNSVTSIGKYAFSGCSGLTSVTIPNSVASIGEWAFSDCSGLTSVTIPNSVTSIGELAFRGCSGLTSVTIPNSVTSIGVGAFYECSGLTSVTIPNSVTSIGRWAFEGCSGLTSVTIEAETPPALGGTNVFYNTNNCPIYVPCGTLDAYKTAWKDYASRIQYMPLQYHITGNVNIDAAGNVKIPQTNKCDEDVSISATPNYGYHFEQWNDGNTDNPRVIELTQDTTFTAEFAKNTYTISTASSNPEWGTTAGDTTALYLDEVEISATSNYGYHFVKWDIEKYQEHIEYSTLHMVKFSVPNTWSNPYAWIWETGASGHWETLSNENGMYVYRTIQSNMNIIIVPNGPSWGDGQTNDLAITESCCYTISGEYDVNNRYVTIKKYDCFSTDEQTIIDKLGTITYVDTTIITNTTNPLSLLVTQNQKAIAYFAKNVYYITKNAEHGSISGNSSAKYLDEVTLTVNPDYGYHFTQWSDGVTDNPRSFILTQDTAFTAEFEKNTYTLSLTTNNPAMGQVEGAGVYGYNTQVNCVAVPYDGYEFVSWDNGIKDNPYILTITEDITLIAMFQPIGEGLFDTKEQASSPRKVLENGQLFILRGEKEYTLTGQEVK